MGFFDFMKEVGANLFGDDDAAPAIEELLNTELPGQITDLKVGFDDGEVVLSGTCDSQATKEKAILLAGNVKGVAKVTTDALGVAESEKEAEIPQFYTIQRGDSLSLIAKRQYGDAMKYPIIFEANREVIKDPDLIYPGQQIRIPKLDS